MDTGGCGFQMSAREIDLLATPEEEFNSRNSISSLLSSAAAAVAPDPAASLQQSFFEAIASYLDHSAPRSHIPSPNSDGWFPLPQRKGFQMAVDSQIPTGNVQISAQPVGGNSLVGGTPQQKGYATGATAPSNANAETAEHLERNRGQNGSGTAKVGKKRSRASRRAPTTVLTTDTSNFRAMVQEFTGIPTAPFAATPFPRSRVDFLGAPRSGLHGGGAAPPFLVRPFPHRTTTAANFAFAPPQPNSSPPPNFLLQSLLQAQNHATPKGSIAFPPGNFADKTSGGLLEELGLSVVLPDLVPSDSQVCKNNMMSNYGAVKVGGGGDRVSDRRSSSSSFNMESSADRNPPRPDRNMVDSWINHPSSDAQSLDRLNVQ